mgnify:CR=1 FL=1
MKTLKRDKVVLDLREKDREQKGILAGQYVHVVEDKIYYQMETPKEIHYAAENEDGYRKPLYNNIITKSLAAHNFSVFLDTNPDVPEDERYKAVGGYHVGRASIETPHELGLHQASLYGELNDCEVSKDLEVVPFPDPVWPQYTKLLFKDDFHHPRHANGLYVFKSADGIKWELYHDKPVLSTFTECLESNKKLPPNTEELERHTFMSTKDVLAFDTIPSVFYDNNIGEYVMYLRANLSLGVRHVMYTHSKDLVNWSTPHLIQTDPSFDMSHGNFYYMCAFPFPNSKKYIAFPPHFKNEIISNVTSMSKLYDDTEGNWAWGDADGFIGAMNNGHHRRYWDAKTKVMISDDGINWKEIDQILSSNTSGHMTFPHVLSFREEGDVYALYVHEDFMTMKNKLVRYTIDKEELDSYVV